MTDAMTNHSDMESLAAFVDGRLEREEREAVVKHIETCEECQGFVREAAAFEQEEEAARSLSAGPPRKTPGRTWWAVAATVALVVLSVSPFAPGFLQRQKLERREQAFYEAIGEAGERRIEARFGGQRTHARLRTPRGETDKKYLVEMASLELSAAADGDLSPAGRRAAALAETVKDPTKALAILNGIPVRARDAAIWNDIAALQHHFGDEQEALEAIKQALTRDPKMPEALFNRAAILKRLEDPGAAAAWQDYLAVEPQGQWADEARNKMSEPTSPQ